MAKKIVEEAEVETVETVAETEEAVANNATVDIITVEQAKQMFAENAGLAVVLTDQGFLSRDGSIVK